MRFTLNDDPIVEDAISAHLARIVAACTRITGVDAVLLGGSLGRGEGTRGVAGLESDIEIYVVGSSPRLRRAAAAVERDEKAAGHDVSVAWVHPRQLAGGRAKNLSWRRSTTIRLYELMSGSRVLAGRLPDMRAIDPRDLPLAEGVRLILNRLAEATPEIVEGTSGVPRWLDKLIIACGDTLLLDAGCYTARYRDRADLIDRLELPVLDERQRERVRACYERKLRGVGNPASAQDAAEIAQAVLAYAVERSLSLDVHRWEPFPVRFAAQAAGHDEFLRYLPPFGPPAVYESLIVIARLRKLGYPLRPIAMTHGLRGRPLSLLLAGAAAPLAFGVIGASPALVSAAVEAMEDHGVPVPQTDAGNVAATLRRYWSGSA